MHAVPRRSDSLRIRTRLIADAREVVEQTGQVPALNELARRNNVGIGTVYRHFGTAQGLLEALAADPLERLLDIMADRSADPVENLHRIMAEQLRLELEHRALSDVLAAEHSGSPAVAELMRRIEQEMSSAVKAAQDTGRVRADLTGVQLRRLLCGLGFAAKQSDDDPGSPAAYLDIAIKGLAQSPRDTERSPRA